MEPVSSVAKAIVLFVDQSRRAATPALSENIEKLSDAQLALALRVIKNTNNIWSSYQEGADPKLEKELGRIVMILSGAIKETQSSEFSLQAFFQSKGQRAEFREKQIANLFNAITKTSLQMRQIYLVEEKSTSTLLKDLEKNDLFTDKQITNQLYRDYSGLIGHIKIEGKTVEMSQPGAKPASWKDLVPEELTTFIGKDTFSDERSLPRLLSQGIAFDPYSKGIELIKDPLMPEAQFHNVNTYPFFEFSKVNNEVFLKVLSKGFLGIQGENKLIPLHFYDISQVINLTNQESLVKMKIVPRGL